MNHCHLKRPSVNLFTFSFKLIECTPFLTLICNCKIPNQNWQKKFILCPSVFISFLFIQSRKKERAYVHWARKPPHDSIVHFLVKCCTKMLPKMIGGLCCCELEHSCDLDFRPWWRLLPVFLQPRQRKWRDCPSRRWEHKNLIFLFRVLLQKQQSSVG